MVREFTGELDSQKVREFTGELDTLDRPSASGRPLNVQAPSFTEALMGQGISDPGVLGPSMVPENIRQGARTALPIIGGTIGSIVAPELAVPLALSKLRFASPAMPFVRNLPKIASAGVGGGVGGGVSASLDEGAGPMDVVRGALQGSKDMALAEATGVGAVSAVKTAAAPFAKKLTEQAKRLIDFATKEKLPISPSSLNPSLTGKVIEGGTDLFLPSRLANDLVFRRSMVQRFNQLATELPQRVGKVKTNEQINTEVLDEFRTIFVGKEQAAKKLAGDFLESIGSDTKLPVKNTVDALRKARTQAVDDRLVDFVGKKLKALNVKGGVTAESLETTLRQIGKVKPKSDTKFLEIIRSAIKQDFKEAGANVGLLEESNVLFKEQIGQLANTTARQLKAMAMRGQTPPSVTVKIFRNGNEDFINTLKKEMSPEVWNDLLAQNIDNMIKNSSTESVRMFGARIIDGTKLQRIIDVNESALKVAYKEFPDTLTALKNLAKLSKMSARDISKFEKGIGQMEGGLMLGQMAGAVFEPTTAIMGGAGSMLLAKSLMSPSGLLKKWLTTGLDVGPKTSQAIKLGGRAVFSEQNGSTNQSQLTMP